MLIVLLLFVVLPVFDVCDCVIILLVLRLWFKVAALVSVVYLFEVGYCLVICFFCFVVVVSGGVDAGWLTYVCVV